MSAIKPEIEQELARRQQQWSKLLDSGGPNDLSPGLLRELGLYGGAQGIWVDKARTQKIVPEGVTVSVLHTGRSYADDLTSDAIIYHYPNTARPPGRDTSEIESTKAAAELHMPVFVITHSNRSSSRRDVYRGWIEGWDERARTFLVSFTDRPPTLLQTVDDSDSREFALTTAESRRRALLPVRPGQARFKFEVLLRYGPTCAVCTITHPALLDAAHIVSKRLKGTDDPRNGLVFCALHHRAFDAGLFGIHPESLSLEYRRGGLDATQLRITQYTLRHLLKKPHPEALQHAWESYSKRPTENALS